MNGWLDGWMTNLSSTKKKKKNLHACMQIRMIINKEKEEK